jgi:hypothetical protein
MSDNLPAHRRILLGSGKLGNESMTDSEGAKTDVKEAAGLNWK